jgi:hypothetical protein
MKGKSERWRCKDEENAGRMSTTLEYCDRCGGIKTITFFMLQFDQTTYASARMSDGRPATLVNDPRSAIPTIYTLCSCRSEEKKV